MIEWSSEQAMERVIAREGSILVVNKPPGIPTSGRSLSDPDCIQFWLMKAFGQMVWAVHQIDADTSGVNLFVLERKLVKTLKDQMALPATRKTYCAVVDGVVEHDVQVVEAPIGKIDERSLGVTESGKFAKSLFRVVARGHRSTLMNVEIETGRTHQIRIHASHLGHPLLGEEWYVDPPCLRHPRQALHALSIEGLGIPAYIPVPDDLLGLMQTEEIPFHKNTE